MPHRPLYIAEREEGRGYGGHHPAVPSSPQSLTSSIETELLTIPPDLLDWMDLSYMEANPSFYARYKASWEEWMATAKATLKLIMDLPLSPPTGQKPLDGA